jgi:hypothetical protein
MSLNRAWYNALVDDDGTNTVGTVWGKDDIKNLLDSVDAEIARIDVRVNGPRTVFTPTVRQDNGTSISIGTNQCSYYLAGDAVFYSLFLITLTVITSSQTLKLTGPPYAAYASGSDETVIRVIPPAGASEWGYCRRITGADLEVRRQADAAFAPGNYSLVGQGFYFLR